MKWAAIFDSILKRHPTWTYDDCGRLTDTQLCHALGIDPDAPPNGKDFMFAVLDVAAERLGLSPAGLGRVPLPVIQRVATEIANEECPLWMLETIVPLWVSR